MRAICLCTLPCLFSSLLCAQASSQETENQPATSQAAGANSAAVTDPAAIKTTVTVNSTLASQVPSSITVLGHHQLLATPGIELDDRLRQVPGFSLFRRSSSLVANPTTQGVSLRATGSSGASRTLILWDGIPINDPFGGWVYWDRLDPDNIAEVDIDRGAATSIFGDRALSGSISLFSPAEQHQHIEADALQGNNGTGDFAAGYSNLWGLWGFSIHARVLTTDGYYITPESVRGTADDRANVRFGTGDTHIDYLGLKDRLSLSFNILAEERHNGTNLTHNSTGLGTAGLTYTHSWKNDQISFLGFHTQEQFHSTYSSVSLDRDHESLSARQTVPVQDTGGALYWQHHAKRFNTFVGADADDTHGISYDYSYNTHILTPSGGTLVEHGLFGQGDYTVGRFRFFAGIRHQFTGQHGETFVSPNGGITAGLGRFRLRTAAYRSFRAPTLNELYRNFRVGNVVTLANSDLVPERLVGVEAGVDWTAENSKVSVTVFRNQLNDLIDNGTLRTTPTLITRQRQNFPSALSRGIEANVNHHWTYWRAEAGYLYADARLATGQRIPQVPKQQGTAQLIFNWRGTLLSGGVRSFGLAFDDDLNQFRLPGFASLQLAGQQHLTTRLSAFAQVDNLLDRTYLVALTPNPNTGAPRIWQVGLRWSGPVR